MYAGSVGREAPMPCLQALKARDAGKRSSGDKLESVDSLKAQLETTKQQMAAQLAAATAEFEAKLEAVSPRSLPKVRMRAAVCCAVLCDMAAGVSRRRITSIGATSRPRCCSGCATTRLGRPLHTYSALFARCWSCHVGRAKAPPSGVQAVCCHRTTTCVRVVPQDYDLCAAEFQKLPREQRIDFERIKAPGAVPVAVDPQVRHCAALCDGLLRAGQGR